MYPLKTLLFCCALLPATLVAAAGTAQTPLASASATDAGVTGPKVTKEQRFASWGMSCAVAQDEKGVPSERCMISQVIATDLAQTKVVLGITIDFLDSPTVPTVRFRFSSGAKASAGIGIKIDNHPDMRLAINHCNPERCEAVGRLSVPALKLWRGGKRGQLAFLFQNGKQVLLPFSLSGFKPALTALESATKAGKASSASNK